MTTESDEKGDRSEPGELGVSGQLDEGKSDSNNRQGMRNKNSGYLLYNLVSRDFKLKYRRSVLGVVWSVLNPLLSMIVMVLIFSNVFRFDIDKFPVYLILGQVLMTLVTTGTSDAMSSIVVSAPLIKKIRIDKIIFPTEKIMFATINFLISLIAVALVLIQQGVIPGVQVVLLPLLVIYVVAFALGIGYLLSALSVFFRDIMHFWDVICTLWFYLTPIFWPIEMLQQSTKFTFMFDVIQWNPMYHYVTYFRDIVLYGIWPSVTENLICLGFAAVSLGVGYLVFKKLQGKFILYV